jgi:arabinofuranosyltransferase
VVLFHTGYYSLVIGGDHFEYRVLSQLVPLAFVSLVALAGRLSPRPALAIGTLVLAVLVSLPVPWVHWNETRDLTTRAETFKLTRPVADRFPPGFGPVLGEWDEWQAWLIDHFVCMRRKEHEVFQLHSVEMLPSRIEGSRVPWEDRHVSPLISVGVPGWVFPEVAIIDLKGLNDRVIARIPEERLKNKKRNMAHDRKAPRAYVNCFMPDFFVGMKGIAYTGGYELRARTAPLDDAKIRDCESRAW